MTMIKIGICDDDVEEHRRLVRAIENGISMTGVSEKLEIQLFSNGKKLIEAERKERFHLVFLDVVAPLADGFEIAAELNAQENHPHIIFISNYDGKIFDTYGYMPLAFVRKSNLNGDVCFGLQMYFSVTITRKLRYKEGDGYSYREVLLADVLYIECNSHELSYHMRSGEEFRVYGSLKSLERELQPFNIIRIHKNYSVNLAYIEKTCYNELLLLNGMTIPMGKAHKKKVDEEIAQYGRKIRGGW